MVLLVPLLLCGRRGASRGLNPSREPEPELLRRLTSSVSRPGARAPPARFAGFELRCDGERARAADGAAEVSVFVGTGAAAAAAAAAFCRVVFLLRATAWEEPGGCRLIPLILPSRGFRGCCFSSLLRGVDLGRATPPSSRCFFVLLFFPAGSARFRGGSGAGQARSPFADLRGGVVMA